MIAKTYLAVIGLMYIALAIWCTLQPMLTSEKVGFSLSDDTGKSEFMTVYGGLEFGIALILLAGIIRPELTTAAVVACVLIHGSLVVFRSASLFLYPNVASMTWKLAVGEWVIMISGLLVWWLNSKGTS